MLKKTKIVCTVGPSTDKPNVLEEMIKAGMNIARFNFSHGTHEEHKNRIELVREAAKKLGKSVALLLDTKGPEMRLGNFAEGKVFLNAGQKFILTAREIIGNDKIVSVNHKLLPQEVNEGSIILLADGLVSLEVKGVVGQDIITEVLNSGMIGNKKRVAVPNSYVNIPFLSEQDVQDIIFGIKNDMDFIAASFVQRAADILAIRKVLEEGKGTMDIIAKIENAEGVKNIDEIINVADGIMVARGDLGVEILTEEVPLVQKMIIEKCNKAGKPVITATQMLESMISNPRPTRAEASDVANAIMDGTDAIMLSGETASGQYPIEAVSMMANIAVRTETALNYSLMLRDRGLDMQGTTTEAISRATVHIAHQLNAAAVITATESGYTARMVSKYRPQANIVAVTPNPKTLRRMLIFWGVQPLLGDSFKSTDEMVANAVDKAVESQIVREGDLVVITAGVPSGTPGTTNMIRVHVIGNVILRGVGIGNKNVTGRVCVVRDQKEFIKFKSGDVLVVRSINEENAKMAATALAIIVEEGGITSPAAIVGISYGIPVLVGVEGATKLINDGALVTVDTTRGLIYQGEINVR